MVSSAVVCDPLVASVPDHPPEAVHEVTSLEDQVKVEVPPLATLLGLAVSITLGVAAAVTVIVTDCDVEPPVPVQVSVNCVVAVSAAVSCDPVVGSSPLQPPVAVQLCA